MDYWFFAISCFPIAIWLWLLPEPSHQMHSDEKKNTPLPLIPVLLCVLLFFLYVGLELGFGNWIYTYATNTWPWNHHHRCLFDLCILGLRLRLAGCWAFGFQPAPVRKPFSSLTCSDARSALSLSCYGKIRTLALWVGTHRAWRVNGFHFPNHFYARRRKNDNHRHDHRLVPGSGLARAACCCPG